MRAVLILASVDCHPGQTAFRLNCRQVRTGIFPGISRVCRQNGQALRATAEALTRWSGNSAAGAPRPSPARAEAARRKGKRNHFTERQPS
ncbi:hypothetical protein FDP22_19200 (plasmid) [Paroceanicella profunda]|uniref:Uncharacterized protein n=1 Tax=Paroceanicella profunda TaxID=2579971 RepID=A0A5B8FIN2_9RHOB|nr:hypothetical protein FDP22_19200 [Paroceanicella profunda]